MALQMATNITPDTFAGVGGAVFDATTGLDVSWQVNGGPSMLAYQITIHQLDDVSTQIYSTGKVILNSPFYGVLANGSVQFFQANTISASELASAGIQNGNQYKMYITQWWGNTDAQSVTNQSAAVIHALSIPTVTIDSYPNPITSRMHTFTATYTQAEDDGIAWVKWVLYDQSNGDAIIQNTGAIYGTSQLQFEYDALFTGTIYGLEVSVETQAGQYANSGIQTIYVSYAAGAATGNVVAVQKCGWNGVNVSWANAKNMIGAAYGEYSFANNMLVLPKGSNVSWGTSEGMPINFADPFSIVWAGSLPSGLSFTPFSASVADGEVSINVMDDSTQLNVQFLFDGVTEASISMNQTIAGTDGVLYVAATPETLYVTVQTETGSVASASAAINAEQSDLTSLRLIGQQKCMTLWVEKGEMEGPIVPSAFNPVYTSASYFLTEFSTSTLNAGNADTTGYILYRLDNTSGEYQKIATLGENQTSIIDYSARNAHSYTYQLWYTSDTIFTRQPFSSNEITPCRWNTLLIGAIQDEYGVYHPQNVYAFGCNVDVGDESNNSKSSIQDTFSGYPSYQPSANRYRTGKLTALIGKIDPYTNEYVNDNADYADEIMRLSTSSMSLFLRDRKGSFRLIKINGAITQKINAKWPNQASTITIPWVEVGDASNLSVVLTNTDDLWPYDAVADTSIYIDTTTGHLMWRVPNDYFANNRGSILALTSAGTLTQQYDGTEVEMSQMHIDARMHLIADQ